jgi:hypothetical protein
MTTHHNNNIPVKELVRSRIQEGELEYLRDQ